MIEFTILYKDRSKKKITAENREALIKNFSSDDATAFQEQVKEIHWTEYNTHYIESVDTGKVQRIPIMDEYES